jgi:hypothetical protein
MRLQDKKPLSIAEVNENAGKNNSNDFSGAFSDLGDE